MSRISFRKARRQGVPLLVGVAGGTGSGKSYSGLRLARGIAGDHTFAAIDTENGRLSHYADQFDFMVADLHPPFRPQRYTEAIDAGVAFLKDVPAEHRVVVVDSMSHEWAGDGGCLDWHAELTGGQMSKNQQGWATVKPAHKKMVTKLLQLEAHVILCFRAEPKIEEIDDPERPGKKKWVAKRSVTALDGWFPIAEKMLPYELTASFLLMAEQPGFPRPIKLQEQHRPFVPLDRPLSEETGAALAAWAAGASQGGSQGTPAGASAEGHNGAAGATQPATREQKLEVVQLASELGVSEDEMRVIVEQVTGRASLRGSVSVEHLGEIASRLRLEVAA